MQNSRQPSAGQGEALDRPACARTHWLLDPRVVYLNHGAFGGCPRHLLEHQNQWRYRMEHQPLRFLARELEGELDKARLALAQFIGAATEDLVFVTNATTGVCAVLHSLPVQPGDELLVTNHEYNATRNALNRAADRSGARVVVVDLPFPFQTEDELVEPIVRAVSPRTKLALLDHVTSQTGIVLPVRRMVRELAGRGVECLIDGAHAPGMIPLDVGEIGAAYYTGNLHKWLCAPKGTAFLHVRRDCQRLVRPLTTSHGANSPRTDRSRFQLEFAWTGTRDYSAWLSVPEVLRYMGSLVAGGWPTIMRRNRGLALAARTLLCETLSIPAPCPDGFVGSIASVPLPDAAPDALPAPPCFEDPLQVRLLARDRIEVPIFSWPAPPRRVLRVAAQLYNALPEYRALGHALRRELGGR